MRRTVFKLDWFKDEITTFEREEDMSFSGKHALIVGGSSGMGLQVGSLLLKGGGLCDDSRQPEGEA